MPLPVPFYSANGRNVNNLLALVPSVVAGGSTYGNAIGNQAGAVGTNFFAFDNYQIGGGFSGQSSFYIDGVLSKVLANNGNPLIPTEDAVAEFRVSTSAPSAEFGGTGGGIVNFVTKSGTNDFHGSAYEYVRNTTFNANNYFNNLNGIPRVPYHQNQYGVNIVNALFPLPNLPDLYNNYAVAARGEGNQDQFNARVDHSFSSKNCAFARYTYRFAGSPGSDPPGTTAGFPIEGITDDEAVIGDTYMVGPFSGRDEEFFLRAGVA